MPELKPPQAKIAMVLDDYHGVKVSDPYRWLEDSSSPETQRFVREENAYTRSVLERVDGREKLRERIDKLLTIGRVGAPRVGGKRYFYERRDGRQNQAVIYVREGVNTNAGANTNQNADTREDAYKDTNANGMPPSSSSARSDGPPGQPAASGQAVSAIMPHTAVIPSHSSDRALIDVNALSPDGTIALDWWYPSDDGRYVAFGTSANGSELSTLQVIEVESGRLLAEKIERTRAASVAWLPDSSGFYYTRYPQPGDVPAGEEMYNRKVFFHRLSAVNADGRQDPLIFPAEGESLDPQHWPNIVLSPDGRWLLVEVSQGWTKSDLYLKDLHLNDLHLNDLRLKGVSEKSGHCGNNSGFVRVSNGENFLYHGEILEDQLYITTNEGAPRFRVFKVHCAQPQRSHWKEIIAESDAVIEGHATIISGKLFVHTIRNAMSQLRTFTLEGKLAADVPMPALGSIFDLGGSWNSPTGFFGFISYAIPPTVYQVNADGTWKEWARVESGIDPQRYQVEQLWFNSKDGTRLPMFVVSRKDMARNGRNPALLSGYGGFNVGRTPFFNRNVMLLLLEQGGVYADVQLRGGNEFGEEWHRSGMLEQKQNVFDDFIAAAEHLVAEKYTDKNHLAIQGGSNGGLLMGAALTQRPDLFQAVVCQVPLLDMLRYQQFQIAKLWILEYGTSDDPKQFAYLHAYSPYHHIKAGTVYPAILFMTAESDTRVDPMHAVKMAARLQAEAANGPERPILLRVDAKAGHGVGKPITKLVDDAVDVWSFLFWQLGVRL